MGVRTTVPVNAAAPPHTHGGGALVATMLKGKMLNQMVCPDDHDPETQGSGPKIYSAGETWYEPPGCHHVRAENAGDEEAEFIATFVIDKKKVDEKGMGALIVIDADVQEEKDAKA